MKKYDFLANVQRHIDAKNDEQKKVILGGIIGGLQRPIQEVVSAVCEKQKKDVDELYKALGWKK